MPEIILHLGAHKTATTAIQADLEQLRPQMAVAGQFHVPLVRSRIAITGPLDNLHRIQNDGIKGWYTRRNLTKNLSHFLRDLAALDASILISDENLLGQPKEGLHGTLYPTAGERLARFAGLLPATIDQVYLAVRDYAPFLASLYVESLRWGTSIKPEALVADYRTPVRHWSGVIDTIKAAFPQAQLNIWRLEDYGTVRSRVMASLCNLPEAMIAALPDENARQGMSAAAVEEVLTLFAATRGSIARQNIALAAEGRYPRGPGEPAYDPWPAEIRAALTQTYEAELDDWERDPRIALIRPKPPASDKPPA